MQIDLGGSNAVKQPSLCGSSELLHRPGNLHVPTRKPTGMGKKSSLTAFCSSIMYAKIRADNWATLYEIDPSNEETIPYFV